MKDTATQDMAPVDRVRDTARATRALRSAVRTALLAHKREGHSVVVWEDGRVKWMPADEIVIPELDDSDQDPAASGDPIGHGAF